MINYEIVKMEAKFFAGVSEVTNNASPDMSAKIGGLWQKFYSGTAQNMKNRVNAKAVGLYYDYQKNGDYTVMAGAEISSDKLADAKACGLAVYSVPAGNYAKFVLHGNVQTVVAEAWGEIWSLPLERTFTGDYEEYQEDCDGISGTIIIYIAVK